MIRAGSMYFNINIGWSGRMLVPLNDKTAAAIALLWGQAVVVTNGWNKEEQGGGPYLTTIDAEGRRVKPPEVTVEQGVDIVEKLAAAPDKLKLLVASIDESANGLGSVASINPQ